MADDFDYFFVQKVGKDYFDPLDQNQQELLLEREAGAFEGALWSDKDSQDSNRESHSQNDYPDEDSYRSYESYAEEVASEDSDRYPNYKNRRRMGDSEDSDEVARR